MLASYFVRLLGSLRVEYADRVITRFRTHQTGALLAFLAYYRESAHPRDALVERLWPEDALDAGRHKLRLALSSLRQQLEPPSVPAGTVLIADRASVQLNPAVVTTDVAGFEAALHVAKRARSAIDRARRLSEAIDLYRADLLPGFFDAWIVPERQRLAESFFQALSDLIALAEEQGDVTRSLQWARRAVAADPLREEAHHDLIHLLIAAGQPEAARRQYGDLEQLLTQELGVEPAVETRRLILELGTAGSQPSRPAAAPISPRAAVEKAEFDPSGTEPGNEPAATASRLSQPPPSQPLTAGSRVSGGIAALLLIEIELPHPLPVKAGMPPPTVAPRTRLRRALEHHGGHVVQETASLLLAAFPRPSEALAAAVAGQHALAKEAGEDPRASAVEETLDRPVPQSRMALHAGEVEIESGRYHGLALDQAARVLRAAHPGQILCTEAAAVLFRGSAEPGKPGIQLLDLGLYRLRDITSGIAAPERLFQILAPGAPQGEFPPPQAPPAHAGHFPLQLTRFFGREPEMARLLELLTAEEEAGTRDQPVRSGCLPSPPPPRAFRLITLTGPGGSGKTRLALEMARRVGEPFYGAVWFVPLADLPHADLIPEALLNALRLPRAPDRDPLDQVREVLAAHPSLLVLDNFEHLVEEGAAIVRQLLERIPTLTCLVTSRRALGLSGEREYPVAPLPVPEVRNEERGMRNEAGRSDSHSSFLIPHPSSLIAFPSVQLFVDRAQAARPDFQITVRNAADIAALCRRLEGIPLAIELAAAWARTVSPAQMIQQLERRFDLLVSRKRDLTGRHQSLRATLDWSYHLLLPELQTFFARLCVFRGGWTAAAAEAVCGDAASHPSSLLPEAALAYLAQLQEHSLILAETVDDSPRFRMLETMREYAAEQLSPEERATVECRHAEYYLALAESAEPELTGPDQVAWLDRLETEHDNLRAALDWCAESAGRTATDGREPRVDGPAEIALRLVAALWWFWTVRGHQDEAEVLCRRVMAIPGERTRTAARARALNRAARMLREPEIMRPLLTEALEICQELGNREGMTGPLNSLGHIVCSQGDFTGGRALYEQCRTIYQELGNEWGAAMAQANEGKAAYYQGDGPAARVLLEASLATMRRLDDQWHIAYSLINLGLVSWAEGRYLEAGRLYREALRALRELSHKFLIVEALEGLGVIAEAEGQPERATRLLAAAGALHAAVGAGPIRADHPAYIRYPAHALARRCEKERPADWAAGQQMPLEEMIAYALSAGDDADPSASSPLGRQVPS